VKNPTRLYQGERKRNIKKGGNRDGCRVKSPIFLEPAANHETGGGKGRFRLWQKYYWEKGGGGKRRRPGPVVGPLSENLSGGLRGGWGLDNWKGGEQRLAISTCEGKPMKKETRRRDYFFGGKTKQGEGPWRGLRGSNGREF